ncbi:MAG: M20/M25/M40 family metallo-hydrolase [Chloroflexota bacterium]|nr:M20/M25/M40 family metallo-hydrolase [Chloroflexota bacterium]
MTDWQAMGDEAARILSRYLQINTTNPPGNEHLAAEMLATLLRERGLEPRLHESAPGRANLLTRLPGDGSAGAIILLHHMDVVTADSTRWSHDPFSGEIRDGYVWGRGAIDMKGVGVMHLLALDLLRRSGVPRKRDIVYLAVADEEMGSAYGVQWLLAHHWPEIEAEYVWDEGGFGLRDFFGPGVVFTVAVAEKQTLWLRLIAEGKPGHGGMPHADNANDILVRALDRVLDYETPLRLHAVTQAMFQGIAQMQPFPRSLLLRHLDNSLALSLARKALTAEPAINAVLRNTLSVTALRAGSKENVIPERAVAVLDVRLLPGEDPGAFVEELEAVVADQRVQVEVIQHPEPTTVSAHDSTLFRAIAEVTARLVPGSITVPMLTPGATDSCFFRRKGINTYGLFPAIITPEDLAGLHGINERISLENLRLGTHHPRRTERDVLLGVQSCVSILCLAHISPATWRWMRREAPSS